jgi:hypothetical protein
VIRCVATYNLQVVGEPQSVITKRLSECLANCLELAEDETPAQYLASLCGSTKDPTIALACINLIRVGCETPEGLMSVRSLVKHHGNRKDVKFIQVGPVAISNQSTWTVILEMDGYLSIYLSIYLSVCLSLAQLMSGRGRVIGGCLLE